MNTATNYKNFALIKNLKHETIILGKERYIKKGIVFDYCEIKYFSLKIGLSSLHTSNLLLSKS